VMTNPSYHAMLSQGATFDEEAQVRLIRMIQTELQDSEQTTLVLRVVHPTSDTLTMLEVNATHVKRNERSVGIVANLRDVTHLYNLDEKRSDLLQLASHEIGTPLDAISAYAKILNDTNTPVAADQRSNILTLIEQQAQEVKRLVVQTLDYSQVKAKMLTQAQERVNLSQLVHELAQEYEPLTHQKGILFHNNIEPDLWVIGQAQALKQAFRNLLENARKFTPAGGNIHWVAFRQNNTVQIEVRDDGIGIPADELGNVFRLYYRASSASDIPGSGLGLSIVQEIIQIHRGRIAVESTEGEGTSFTVTLAATAA
jgi:signal transduction histidine kinase